MISHVRATVLTMLFVALAAGPIAAQDWKFDVGINGGGSWYSSALDEDHLNTDAEAAFEAGWLTGAQATYWFSNMLGLRANGTYSERPFELDNGGDRTLLDDVNLWSGSGDLMIRFMGDEEQPFLGFDVLPYLALGAGAKWVNPAAETFDDDFFDDVIDDDEDRSGAAFNVGGETFLMEEDATLMGLAGLGADMRVAENFAVRLEVGDRFYDAPIIALEDDLDPIEDGEEDTGNVIHEPYGQLGLHYLFGVAQPERVAAVPAPPPPPEEELEEITVCVVNPGITTGVAEIDALYDPASGDTLVVVNGQRVPLDRVAREAVVVEDEDWFIEGEPLTLDIEGEEASFISFGGARVIDPSELAFLGTVNGLPVYADANDVDDLDEEIRERREARMEGDLEEVLEQEDDLREEFEEVDVLYAPLEPTGCVFQPLERIEEVRKMRG